MCSFDELYLGRQEPEISCLRTAYFLPTVRGGFCPRLCRHGPCNDWFVRKVSAPSRGPYLGPGEQLLGIEEYQFQAQHYLLDEGVVTW